jgi:hypothetical protein
MGTPAAKLSPPAKPPPADPIQKPVELQYIKKLHTKYEGIRLPT